MVTVGDHYRPPDDGADEPVAEFPDGVYRVVGATGDVALLRVGTPDGERVVTGDLHRVPRETVERAFEPTRDPDAGFTPASTVRNALSGLYWQFRRFS